MELDIHPKKKKPVGERLALLAEKIVYGEELLCESPRLCAMEAGTGRLVLRFENAGDGLYLADHTPDGAATDPHRLEGLTLLIDGETIDPGSVTAAAVGEAVILSSPDIREGHITAELGWGSWYRINLYNSAGLPARPGKLVI